MPTVEDIGYYQKAVLWESNGYDGDGNNTASDPVEVNVRWEETNSQSPDGQVASEISVHINQEVATGSAMWLGELTSLPAPVESIKEVKSCAKIPDVKGRKIKYVLSLGKFGDATPTVT